MANPCHRLIMAKRPGRSKSSHPAAWLRCDLISPPAPSPAPIPEPLTEPIPEMLIPFVMKARRRGLPGHQDEQPMTMPSAPGRGAVTALIGVSAAFLWSCTIGPYRNVDIPTAVEGEVTPAVLAPSTGERIADIRAWRAERERLLEAFAREIYGPAPPLVTPRIAERRTITARAAGGVAGVEELRIELGVAADFNLVLVIPPGHEEPLPLIVLQNYCGNRAAFPNHPTAISPPLRGYPRTCQSPVFDPMHRAWYGRWINGPPFALAARRGYALALFYGGDVVPDRPADGAAALDQFGNGDMGALAAWAWMTSRIVDVLAADSRLDQSRIVAWGQSRYGKTALLAGTRDERFAAVVAFQSGRGGDALTRHRTGESVAGITRTFPHWFTSRFAAYAETPPPIDQHQLLALMAPRPLLIGHARRDGWSDPVGAHIATLAATPAFDLYGAPPPQFLMRDGRHGVVIEDWEATFDFLDARLHRLGG